MRLREWCENNKYGYKILLTDNVKNVNRLKRITNNTGIPITNLEGLRMPDFAKRIIIDGKANEGDFEIIEEADHDLCTLLMYKLLREENTYLNDFIPKECICMETAEELLRIVNIIRAGKKKPEFHNTQNKREEQIKRVINDYEGKLRAAGLYDSIMMLQSALDIMRTEKVRVDEEIGIFSYMLPYLTYTEKEFLYALTESPVEIDVMETDNDPISIECCEVYGQFNEIQKIISDISEKQIPYGQVNILYSSFEYENIISMALKERDIPFTFLSGHGIQDKPYISLVIALSDWVLNDYDYSSFRPVIDNEIVALGADYLSGVKAGIGWGLERYKLFYEQMERNRDEYISIIKKHRIKNIGEDKSICSDGFIAFVHDITDLFLECDTGSVDTGKLYEGIISLIKEKVKGCDWDRKSLSLLEGLKGYFTQVGIVSNLQEAISFISEQISSLQLSDDEETNAVNVMRIGKTEVLERPFQYCVGMSYEAFGTRTIDSPVLTDDMLDLLLDANAGYVEMSLDRGKVKAKRFEESIHSMPSGHLLMCASIFDTRNLRETALSEKYIEYRGKDKVKAYGFSNVLKANIRYSIDKEKLFAKKEKKKNTKKNNGYNWGFVQEKTVDGHRHILLNGMSATAITNVIDCPLKYEYYINYFDNDLWERRVNIWLPAIEKGRFFHQVFQEYCEMVIKDKVISSTDVPDWQKLKEIFDNAIYEFDLLVPKGSSQAFELEKEVYYEQIKLYIDELYKEMSASDKDWKVVFCEKEFETEALLLYENDENCEREDCDVIELSFKGFIDRIDSWCDESGTEHFRMIDYKCGKKDRFEEKLKKNQAQYVIYPMAMKNVDSFRYDFPCDGNDFCEPKDIENFPEEYRKRLIDVFLKPEPSETGENVCDHCDFKDICARRMKLGQEVL